MVELSPIIENTRGHLAHNVRELWHFGACHDALERAATHFSSERPWIEGWIGFRIALRFEGDAMPDEVRARLTALIDGLKPTDILHQARAVVLARSSFGWDVADGDVDDGISARRLRTGRMAGFGTPLPNGCLELHHAQLLELGECWPIPLY